MKLTNNEQWILDYLKGKDYVSPTKIGYAHTHASGITGELIVHGLLPSVYGW